MLRTHDRCFHLRAIGGGRRARMGTGLTWSIDASRWVRRLAGFVHRLFGLTPQPEPPPPFSGAGALRDRTRLRDHYAHDRTGGGDRRYRPRPHHGPPLARTPRNPWPGNLRPSRSDRGPRAGVITPLGEVATEAGR